MLILPPLNSNACPGSLLSYYNVFYIRVFVRMRAVNQMIPLFRCNLMLNGQYYRLFDIKFNERRIAMGGI